VGCWQSLFVFLSWRFWLGLAAAAAAVLMPRLISGVTIIFGQETDLGEIQMGEGCGSTG